MMAIDVDGYGYDQIPSRSFTADGRDHYRCLRILTKAADRQNRGKLL